MRIINIGFLPIFGCLNVHGCVVAVTAAVTAADPVVCIFPLWGFGREFGFYI